MLAVFAILVLVPLAVNWWASRNDFHAFADAFAMSVMLIAFWIITNVMHLLFGPPASYALNWLVDGIGGAIAIAAWSTQKANWKIGLAMLFMAQLVAHSWYWVALIYFPEPRLNVVYQTVLNVLWCTQLACVAFPGGRHGLRHLIGRIHRRSSGHHRAGA